MLNHKYVRIKSTGAIGKAWRQDLHDMEAGRVMVALLTHWRWVPVEEIEGISLEEYRSYRNQLINSL